MKVMASAARASTPHVNGARAHVVIIGGGISGLSAAYYLTRYMPDAQITLLERDVRLGGKIVTEHVAGFTIEGGPEAMLVAKPQALALCQELGIGHRLIGANPARTFVSRHGRLLLLPEGLASMTPARLWPIAVSRLISPAGKLRMGLDLIIPAQRGSADETVAGFVERRLGREAYRWLVDPLVSGIYSGDGHRLSLAATFPQWRCLERKHGGLIAASLATKRSVRRPQPNGASSPFQAPRGGLGELVAALAARLHEKGIRIETGVAATTLARGYTGGYDIALATGGTIAADAVVCAVPAPAAARLFTGLDVDLAAGLRAIPHASTATVALAYANQAIPLPLDGSGYLTPRAEQRAVSACTWVSAKWADRAPEGASLIRVSLGGSGREQLQEESDDALIALAQEEMHMMLGIAAPPLFTRLFRWPHAMPQYETGHLERVAEITSSLAAHPGLALAGNAYRGVGLADCVESGAQAAERISAALATRVAAEGSAAGANQRLQLVQE